MQVNENQAIESPVVEAEQPILETTPVEEVAQEEVAQEEVEVAGDSEEQDTEVEVDGDEPFPKKASRALERRNKKINKLRAENAELNQKLAELQAKSGQIEQAQEALNDGLREPREEDFESYADYLEAKGEFKAKRAVVQKEMEILEQKHQQDQQQWVQQRAKYVDDRAAEAVKTIPELNGLYSDNQDIIEGYADTTKLAFLEAEKPELAFYALAKEGKLEALDNMSPTQVAREIALAEIRGEKLSKQRPVTEAPKPIKKARGSSTRAKSLDDMPPTELLNHLKKSKRK